jgi:DNA-binding Lrp family transcriptional regulator
MTLSEKLHFDEVDRKIITLLQENPDMTHNEIAGLIGRSQPTIGIRLRKLLKSGAFLIQPGVNFRAVELYMGRVNIQTKNPEKIFELAECCPFVLNCFSVSGDYNIVLLIVSTKLEYIDAIVNTHFRKSPHSNRVKVEIVLDIAKDFTIPVRFEEQQLHDPTNHKNCIEECDFCHQYLLTEN